MPELGLVKYKLIRSKRKTLSLQIDKDGALSVRAPMRLSVKKIESFICEKQVWIETKQTQIRATKPDKINYQAGGYFLFLGYSYPLKLDNTEVPVRLNNKKFYLSTIYDAASAFHWFYKKEFIKIALPRLEYYSQKHNLIFNQVRFKAQKTRWGSCSSQNNINLNYLLMMAPMWVIDAVIAHELAHIAHKNHSKDFYQLLDSMISTRKQADIWLKDNAQKLHNL
ncbi:M48 family metallopeptidase [bacterium endosymbiont of Bathymodiolus sp. 5 South]|jgi:predicted metal-dependent hydrolase|uniref:M48 family metallopeptidase n=1 Tax=bacterium endosymbiont of Bathymodiolus sp. 5 South TaxID=1181670 RepID=UPI0010B35D6F|nr:SprT family zinc-dependent metalloprotease [bacterium endosymbiont of Bathymodiolus sp. 5 South]CAC9646135.1 Putative predicted metal-dependent hydrolase [uncultured Gammaproteobacteria bacterium]CAC9657269.1 Putative predicted metal-dependent hydrolase [uncultured Gammaproteobacteria bacterium]SHN91459.1 Putative predicted metal-dependent hydrolase [bacterium endosymbiont of Bathymodiolus sp. 5 South]SSC09123.1 Putative predicted metal-dependent hydrolase [bacterium endosymbiont of Bathymod